MKTKVFYRRNVGTPLEDGGVQLSLFLESREVDTNTDLEAQLDDIELLFVDDRSFSFVPDRKTQISFLLENGKRGSVENG